MVGAQYLQLETTKFGRILIRETITMTVGTSNDDLVRNLVRMIFEERIGPRRCETSSPLSGLNSADDPAGECQKPL